MTELGTYSETLALFYQITRCHISENSLHNKSHIIQECLRVLISISVTSSVLLVTVQSNGLQKQAVAQSRNSHSITEPKGSSPLSQEPVTIPYLLDTIPLYSYTIHLELYLQL
jgi:hypothetical protein